MVDSLIADTDHVVEALNQIAHRDHNDDDVKVSIYDTDVIARGITYDEARDRNLFRSLEDEVCRLRYDGFRLTVGFHQNELDTEFTLRPASTDAVPPVRQSTDLDELAPRVADVVDELRSEIDVVSVDFMEVSSASIAHGGYFTDFEFEFAVSTTDLN